MAKSLETPSTLAGRAAPVADKQRSKALVLIGISLGYFMVLLDLTIVNVALPAIGQVFGGGIAGLQWVLNAYTLVFASLLLGAGVLADQFGSRRIFIWGLILFVISSALSAFAPSLLVLIALRALLGIGAALITPASMALISHSFPDPKARARATGLWASITVIGMAAGPVIGGTLVDTIGWRGIFLINVPIAFISLVMVLRLVSETPLRPVKGFDFGGQITSILAIAALTYALIEGSSLGWTSPLILAAFAVTLVMVVAFLIIESRIEAPMLPLRLFTNATISAGMYAGLVINFALAGQLLIFSLFFQQDRGYTALIAGLAFLPMTIPMVINATLTGRIVSRIGSRIPMLLGFSLNTIGLLIHLLTNAQTSFYITAIGLFFNGVGMTMVLPALILAMVTAAPKDLLGTISGSLNSSRQLGGAIGVAVLGTILSSTPNFAAGFHLALIVAAAALASGLVFVALFVHSGK